MIAQTLATIITFFFLLIILSYYCLFFIKKRTPKHHKKLDSISIIIPAHNEEQFIKECIQSVLSAKFKGKKQIIAVDDGSIDKTKKILSTFKQITLLKQKHSGKAAAINKALKIATGDIIAIVDADSTIEKDALEHMANTLSSKNIAAATGIVKVKNRHKYVNMWAHIEQIYNSLMRSLLSKLNANIVTPGPLSMYKKTALKKIGGFSTKGFSEDVIVTLKLIRKGYDVGFSEKSIAYTNMPYKPKNFLRQRTRFARGMIYLFKKHMGVSKKFIDLYTMPILLFTYIQAIIIGAFTIYQITNGYMTYYASQEIYFSLDVLKFLFEWFSIVGFIKWAYNIIIGAIPLNFANIIGIISTLLSYPLYFIAIFKIDKKIDFYHIIPLFFMFPFWLLIMIIYILCIPELFKTKQKNIWKKNE